MVDSALQRARARALGEKAAAPVAPQDKTPTTSVRTVKLQTGEVVPEQFYDLAPEDQQRMLELIQEREVKRALLHCLKRSPSAGEPSAGNISQAQTSFKPMSKFRRLIVVCLGL